MKTVIPFMLFLACLSTGCGRGNSAKTPTSNVPAAESAAPAAAPVKGAVLMKDGVAVSGPLVVPASSPVDLTFEVPRQSGGSKKTAYVAYFRSWTEDRGKWLNGNSTSGNMESTGSKFDASLTITSPAAGDREWVFTVFSPDGSVLIETPVQLQ